MWKISARSYQFHREYETALRKLNLEKIPLKERKSYPNLNTLNMSAGRGVSRIQTQAIFTKILVKQPRTPSMNLFAYYSMALIN